MKKSFKIFSILLLIILCTGCIKYEGEMKVDKYKGMELKVIYATSLEDGGINTSSKDRLIKNGFSVNKYKENNFKGVTVSYQTKNIDKISTNQKIEYNLVDMDNLTPNGMFTVKKGIFKNKYSSNLVFDPSKYIYKYECEDGEVLDYELYEEGMNCNKVDKEIDKDTYKFVVTVDNGVGKNNADTVDDNTLIWNIRNDKVTNLEFEFECVNYLNIIIIIAVVFFVIMFILTTIANTITIKDKEKIMEEKRKRAKKEAMAERVVKKEVVKKKHEEVKKEMEDTDLSDMFDSNYNNKKKIPEMKKEKLNDSGQVESSFKDLYK